MRSEIAQIAARYLTPLLLVISVVVLLRGHHLPGGGFIAALLAATGLIYRAVVDTPWRMFGKLPLSPSGLIAAGMGFCLLAALAGFLAGEPLLTALWTEVAIPVLGEIHLGTPMLFDTGIYLAVSGGLLLIALLLLEEIKWT